MNAQPAPLFYNRQELQLLMQSLGISGWLLYDFRCSNLPMRELLGLQESTKVTRRLYFFLPCQGPAVLLRHAVDSIGLQSLEKALAEMEDKVAVYSDRHDLREKLKAILGSSQTVAMEYSKGGHLPYISCVDAGCLEFIESLGPKVVESVPLLSEVLARFDQKGHKSHIQAARALDEMSLELMAWVHKKLHERERITEYDAAKVLRSSLENKGMQLDQMPIVAAGENSADPHYIPQEKGSKVIEKNQVLLIDVWCKQKEVGARYADICRMAYTGRKPTPKMKEVFSAVCLAQAAAIDLLRKRAAASQEVFGFELDREARSVIERSGYGRYFTHRLGHSIDYRDHGNGTHLDDFETHDYRKIVTRSAFSIEPGIYLPKEFGVRLESDIYIDRGWGVHVTGGMQEQWQTLDPEEDLKLYHVLSPLSTPF